MRKLFLVLACLSLVKLSAQTDSSDHRKEAEKILRELRAKKRPYLELNGMYGALTNSVSFANLAEFSTTDFLTNTDKDDLLKDVNSSLRLGFFKSYGFKYVEPGYPILDVYHPGQSFGITNHSYIGSKLSSDLVSLLFYGNKPFLGQEMDLGNSVYESWQYTSLDYCFDWVIDTVFPIHFTVSINAGHNHNYFHINDGSLFTHTSGEHLDLDLEYHVRARDAKTSVLAGIGAGIGVEVDFKLPKKAFLNIKVSDFGFIAWDGGKVVDVDSSFRFSGLYFDNILDISDSVSNANSNRYRNAFYKDGSTPYTRLTPFKVGVHYKKPLKGNTLKAYSVSANYQYLPGNLPSFIGATYFKLSKNQELVTELALGSYSNYALNLKYALQIGKLWKLQLALFNFNSLVVPTLNGGAVGMLSVQYEL